MPVALRGQMRGGTIIPLAVPAARRMAEFPDVPTLHELGFPAFVVTTWFAIAAPAGLPRWHRRAHEPGDRDGACDAGCARSPGGGRLERATMWPPELTAFVQAELAKWAPWRKARSRCRAVTCPGCNAARPEHEVRLYVKP
ncbi:MAG: tripartite tricarboxylate transporter substrate-binding protein [Xanthobacteraceae bacterium]